MAMTAKMAQDLGDVIEALNPYSSAQGYLKTGEMDLYAGESTPQIPPQGSKSQIIIETDDKYAGDYAGEWAFKGQSQRIAKAVRIRYRVPVLDQNNNPIYYIDDYLMIGFEGSNGG